uniref:NADH-ubiquinone oxidoreductase chain 4L n=1 Tax=Gardineria hawaiiensis TaxID=703464 RepID=A0A7T1TV94_9CNID|nr:NADH dehydrogenase subunit 4L [Gardineria hawaiiensis]QPP20608.1 NADH dehydrogenase subunit 4L [Gardineria hawaiiensis]
MYGRYMLVGVVLLLSGCWGVALNRGHYMLMIVSIELILLAAFFLFLINSIEKDLLIEQIFTIMGLTIAAAESAIGLAIMIAYYRIRGTIILKSFGSLRG